MRARHALPAVLALAAATAALAAPPGGLEAIQRESKKAIEAATAATVSVVPDGSEDACSGVVVTRAGLVLSDWDASRAVTRKDPRPKPVETVKVRVPDLKTGAFTEYAAKVVKVLPELDSALIQILKPPAAGLRCLPPATSADMHVGAMTFAAGNSFGISSDGLPTLTAGLVSAATYLPDGDAGGRFALFFTSAAVNPGVQGGPLVDAQGRLVAMISSWIPPAPGDPFQYLARAVPIDRLRAAYASVPEAKDVFGQKPPTPPRADETEALESVVLRAAMSAYPSVASLVVRRAAPVNSTSMGSQGKPVTLPRYQGPVSAIVVSADGWLVTSLHNLTNVTLLDMPGLTQALPPEAQPRAGLESIGSITACFSDGTHADARLVAVHEPLGFALLKADVGARPVLPEAPPTAYEPGRFVIPVANPFGARPLPEPMLNLGVVSKRHADESAEVWRGNLQTDAGGTDGNCGAAVVDLEGRLVGMLTLWRPVQHGRNSGIAFVVPWEKIRETLGPMSEGRRRPFLGVSWAGAPDASPKIREVVKGSAAEAAGLKADDVIVSIDGAAVKTVADCMKVLSKLWSGDRVKVLVDRAGQPFTADAELGARE